MQYCSKVIYFGSRFFLKICEKHSGLNTVYPQLSRKDSTVYCKVWIWPSLYKQWYGWVQRQIRLHHPLVVDNNICYSQHVVRIIEQHVNIDPKALLSATSLKLTLHYERADFCKLEADTTWTNGERYLSATTIARWFYGQILYLFQLKWDHFCN